VLAGGGSSGEELSGGGSGEDKPGGGGSCWDKQAGAGSGGEDLSGGVEELSVDHHSGEHSPDAAPASGRA
jgi:hypothetical protein